MKYLFALLFPLLLSGSLHAEELIQHLPLTPEPLTLEAAPGQQLHPLIEIAQPGIRMPVYAVKGWVRYENLAGDGYLQMDSHFGESGTFFSKTLARSGPLARLSGSSDWRPFTLPFYANTGEQSGGTPLLPQKLTLALYLPGPGSVSIRDLALYQYAPGEDPLQASGQWFGDRDAGLIGAIGGSLLGVWGAVIGGLGGRGRARSFVMTSANALLVAGIASAGAGLWALLSGQPYAVWFTLLLIGVILVVVMGSLRGSLNARYEQYEMQKMRSMDL